MCSKKKETVWHKKKGKFIPPSRVKAHSTGKDQEDSPGKKGSSAPLRRGSCR